MLSEAATAILAILVILDMLATDVETTVDVSMPIGQLPGVQTKFGDHCRLLGNLVT